MDYTQTYFIFAAFNFAACLHIFFCFPETAGRTLEEVEEIFDQGHAFSAGAITRDVGKKTINEVVAANKQLSSKYLDQGPI